MLLDGALNLLFLVVFVAILALWRPKANNQLGMEQLASTEDEYLEIELGRVQNAAVAPRKPTREEDDIFELDLNEGFESEDEDNDEVLNWAEATLAAERQAENDASKRN